MGKALQRETQMRIATIDMDAFTSVPVILNEILSQNGSAYYPVAYRHEQRRVEEFRALDYDKKEDRNFQIRDGGVYVITGGAGGIGLAFAEYLSKQACVIIVLIGRSKLPDRSVWESIQSDENNSGYNKIQSIKSIEKNGSQVIHYSMDVSDYSQMEAAFQDIRGKFGKLTAIIHSAGLPSDRLLKDESIEMFDSIINPKITGTLNIDLLTQSDDLDFLLLCSSVATVFPLVGQSAYVAANSYLDAFAFQRNKLGGKNTVAINWVAWKETGWQ